jgi:hypothetical protein
VAELHEDLPSSAARGKAICSVRASILCALCWARGGRSKRRDLSLTTQSVPKPRILSLRTPVYVLNSATSSTLFGSIISHARTRRVRETLETASDGAPGSAASITVYRRRSIAGHWNVRNVGKWADLYDHAPEGRWRHLDTMQFETSLK